MASALSLAEVSLTLPSASGPVAVLQGVSLEVRRGETVALIGPSGSGKTSLLMVSAGLEAASAGRIAVAGESLDGRDEDALARFRLRHVGIVFQSFHLIPTMTALENVALPLELAGHSEVWEAARQALDEVGLGHRVTHYPSQLSGGEQQRVAIARALVMRPTLMLADEPTGNLDQETSRHIVDLLFARREATGATLLLITHDAALAGRCDRIVHMRDGRIVDSVSAA